MIHHLRKAESADPIDQISGSAGISGAVDTIYVMNRVNSKNLAPLFFTGRDLEQDTINLQFDEKTLTWTKDDRLPCPIARTPDRQVVIDLLAEENKPMRPIDIAEKLGYKDSNNLRQLMVSMYKAGEIDKVKYGWYGLVDIDYNNHNDHNTHI